MNYIWKKKISRISLENRLRKKEKERERQKDRKAGRESHHVHHHVYIGRSVFAVMSVWNPQ